MIHKITSKLNEQVALNEEMDGHQLNKCTHHTIGNKNGNDYEKKKKKRIVCVGVCVWMVD